PESTTARVAASSPAEVGAASEQAIARATAMVERAKGGRLDGVSVRDDISVLDAYDEADAALTDAANRAELISLTHPDPAMRDAADAARQAIGKVATDVSLDRDLYDALASLDTTDFDPATRHFHDRTLLEFRRAGVDRDDATRARVRELREELVAIGQDFDRNIRTDTRTARLPAESLAGLPDDYVRAHPADDDGLVTITTDYPDLTPFLTYARDATAREELWRLQRMRAYPANIDVLRRMLQRRHELATLLGYPNWAEYAAEDKMIASARNVSDFIDRIADAASDRAARDYDELLARKQLDSTGATAVERWDVSYLDDRI